MSNFSMMNIHSDVLVVLQAKYDVLIVDFAYDLDIDPKILLKKDPFDTRKQLVYLIIMLD